MKNVSVKLQKGLVVVETDPSQAVLPAALWKEIQRVGFLPAQMEVWATGVFDAHSFALDGGRWALVKPGPADSGRRRAHFKVMNGGEDPPQVEFVE